MKKTLATTGLLTLIAFSLYFSGCNGDKHQNKIDSLTQVTDQLKREMDSIKEAAPAYWEAYLDTLGYSQVYKMAPPARPRPIKPWVRAKTYTLCINANLKNGAKGIIVTVENPQAGIGRRVMLQTKITTSGIFQVTYVHFNSKVTPEISIQVVDRNGNTEDCPVNDSLHAPCSPGFVVKDKVSSTANQGSTVQVTIDER